MKTYTRYYLPFAIIATALAGCWGNGDGCSIGATARIDFVNALTNIGPIDIFFNGKKVIKELAFLTEGKNLKVTAGNSNIRVSKPTGEVIIADTTKNINLATSTAILFEEPDGTRRIRIIDNSGVNNQANPNKARVRFVLLSKALLGNNINQGNNTNIQFDLKLRRDSVTTDVLSNQPLGTISNFQEVDPGMYSVIVTQFGQSNSIINKTIDLPENESKTVFIADSANGDSTEIFVK